MKSTPPASAAAAYTWDMLEAALVRHREYRSAFLSHDDGRVFIADLEKRERHQGDLRAQLLHELPNKLKQRKAVKKIKKKIAKISLRIKSDGARHPSDGAVKIPSTPKAVAGSVVHTLAGRRNVLSPAIERAVKSAAMPDDPRDVWNTFVGHAQAVPPLAPLTGYSHGSVSYTGGSIDKASFLKRLKRDADKRR